MKHLKYGLCAATLFAALAFNASAAVVSCSQPTVNPVFPGSNFNYGAQSSFTCGPLTFSMFEVASNSNGTNSPPYAGTVINPTSRYDTSLGQVFVDLNPNLAAMSGSFNEDLHLFFQVTSTVAVTGLDLTVGGSNGFVTERPCSTNDSSGTCTSGNLIAGTPMSGSGTLAAQSGQTVSDNFFTPQTNFYIFKDIGLVAPGELTSFTESFTVSGVPEPASMTLIGSGLLALGLVSWRRKKAGN